LITKLDAKILGLESIKELYATDSYFAEPYSKCCDGKVWEKYHNHDGFFYFELTNYAFQIALFEFAIVGSSCRWSYGTLWSQEDKASAG
jgi:hypothetical protein